MAIKTQSFKDFLPSGYACLVFYDNHKKKKYKIHSDLILSMQEIGDNLTVVTFLEGPHTVMITTPYSFQKIAKVFSEGVIY